MAGSFPFLDGLTIMMNSAIIFISVSGLDAVQAKFNRVYHSVICIFADGTFFVSRPNFGHKPAFFEGVLAFVIDQGG